MTSYLQKNNKLKDLKLAAVDLLDELTCMYSNDDIVRDERFGREWFEIVARMEEVVDVMSAGNILMARSDELTTSDRTSCSTIAVLLRRYNNVKHAAYSEYLDWVVIHPNLDQLEELLRLQQDINTKAVNLLQYVTETW
jgi:hypothetical protein